MNMIDNALKLSNITEWHINGKVFCCLPVGFLLFRYSILFTVDLLIFAFSPLYIDLYVLGDDALVS